MTKEINIQITYVKNLLRSLSYLSIQRLRFFEIILSKLLRLDVNFVIHKNQFFLYLKSSNFKGSCISTRYNS